MITILEWLAFSLSMLCVFCYGKSNTKGAIIGIITALSFILWGIVADIYAASVTNVIFLGLHIRNLRLDIKRR